MAGVVDHPPASREKSCEPGRHYGVPLKVELALLVFEKTGGVGEIQ